MSLKLNYIEAENRKSQIIFAGRIDKTKGIDKLLTAWQRYHSIHKNHDVKLIICGSGPEEQWCKDYIQSNELDHCVIYKGFIENQKVVEMIAESLAFILPTQWYEGFPMTIVEAYRYGTPVLGSNIGNVGDLVIDDVTGYTFECKSINSIIEAINKLLKAIEDGTNLYDNTFEHYRKHYTAKENFEMLRDIYKKITS
ncbi:glycosyltransferase [Priestia megaterium]|uniref:glycosyltransferase n=1 Tax=Priestia megaterium TaxID=1404 RepID=UPI0020A07097|nr:glycosyltransferase [Priestia megaterium]MCP1450458.1 glycosyltransferase involved in cell wall biosynthesis [Priestia megaterium]